MFTGLQSPISSLGLGVQNSELALDAFPYLRVVIMAGAHVDGARIHLPPLDTPFRFVLFLYIFSPAEKMYTFDMPKRGNPL